MVYRFKPSGRSNKEREKKPFRRAGADSPKRFYGYRVDEVDLSMLFELNKLEGRVKKRLVSRFIKRASCASKKVFLALRRFFAAVWISFAQIFYYLLDKARKRRDKKRRADDVYILAGAFVAVCAVAVLSFVTVLYTLMISDYFGRHEKIIVPEMVGKSYNEVREVLGDKQFNVIVSYEYSQEIPEGSVISQSPSGGAERKVFSRGEPCLVSLVVSRGKEMHEMGDYVGMSVRDASLELRNSAFCVVVSENRASDVPIGSVISTTPAAGEPVEVGGVVILHVSAKKTSTLISVPSIVGMSEMGAIERIRALGFTVGEIEYKSSPHPVGTVIAQSIEGGTKVQRESKIDFSVSAGKGFSDKTVPSLYGLSVDEAREKLKDYGLVCGNVYDAGSTESGRTVIAQSPAAGSAISPSLVSVDIYVS